MVALLTSCACYLMIDFILRSYMVDANNNQIIILVRFWEEKGHHYCINHSQCLLMIYPIFIIYRTFNAAAVNKTEIIWSIIFQVTRSNPKDSSIQIMQFVNIQWWNYVVSVSVLINVLVVLRWLIIEQHPMLMKDHFRMLWLAIHHQSSPF